MPRPIPGADAGDDAQRSLVRRRCGACTTPARPAARPMRTSTPRRLGTVHRVVRRGRGHDRHRRRLQPSRPGRQHVGAIPARSPATGSTTTATATWTTSTASNGDTGTPTRWTVSATGRTWPARSPRPRTTAGRGRHQLERQDHGLLIRRVRRRIDCRDHRGPGLLVMMKTRLRRQHRGQQQQLRRRRIRPGACRTPSRPASTRGSCSWPRPGNASIGQRRLSQSTPPAIRWTGIIAVAATDHNDAWPGSATTARRRWTWRLPASIS